MSTPLTPEEIELYILNHTEAAKPECSVCFIEAELYDSYDGENFCKECLITSLNKDPEEVRNLL